MLLVLVSILENDLDQISSKGDGEFFLICKQSLSAIPGFELVVRNSQFAKRFGSLQMSFCIFTENCESLKSDTS